MTVKKVLRHPLIRTGLPVFIFLSAFFSGFIFGINNWTAIGTFLGVIMFIAFGSPADSTNIDNSSSTKKWLNDVNTDPIYRHLPGNLHHNCW